MRQLNNGFAGQSFNAGIEDLRQQKPVKAVKTSN